MVMGDLKIHIDEAILKLLKNSPSDFISGEEISRQLKVTRTAVWKRINHLRKMGYEIEGETHSGYRLIRSPDLLIPSEVKPDLKTQWMGKTIHHFLEIDSTNSKAYQLAMEGAEEGEVVVAESQSQGRGRLGREWFSPPYLNLYLSIILRPKIPPHQASLMTLMAAVATAEAIHSFSGLKPSIKWPNDLLLGEKKVAGLLNEIHSEADRIHFVILGIGVNLNMETRMFPKELWTKATSLKIERGEDVSRKEFFQILLKTLERWYATFLKEGATAILDTWRRWATLRGRLVKITSFGDTLVGKAIDIDSDGALILETKDGTQRRILAGDVEYFRG